MVEEKSSPGGEGADPRVTRVPPTAAGIQVNVCKNPQCTPEDILYFQPRARVGLQKEESPFLQEQEGASNQPG